MNIKTDAQDKQMLFEEALEKRCYTLEERLATDLHIPFPLQTML